MENQELSGNQISFQIEEKRRPVIGITHGDMNGISYEIILKALREKEMIDFFVPVIYGSAKAASAFRKNLGLEELMINLIPSTAQINRKRVNMVNIFDKEIKMEVGQPIQFAGFLAAIALEQAVNDLKKKQIDAIVTAPINKQLIQSPKFDFPGHTEFFANRFDKPLSDVLMFMIFDTLRIGFVTNHLPMKTVASTINTDLIIHKAMIMNKSLQYDFGIMKPKIAILALNPHAGDHGFLGDEEQKIITPAIEKCQAKGMMVYGPYPADGFFATEYRHFDGILAMYHDQGMVPFKALSAGEGVNFTAGLPIVRTSPAHGTAYDIAGKGIADEQSMKKALFLARDILNQRTQYEEMYSDPLKVGIATELMGTVKEDESIILPDDEEDTL
ncbi:MAG: 4-hydroxythreonine-4-phosphate dehydrogenase PdxA [Bacteroidales bacterium]|nr:4-hydroxythreonine-4-phosphate dehydrogenase PdxA [Bacteroidales bacterium]